MKQSYDVVERQVDDLNRFGRKFVLSPTRWAEYSLPVNLSWASVRFDENEVQNLPNDLAGVYMFLIKVGIGGLPGEYIMYVGQTTRNFRVRFQEYLRAPRSKRERFSIVQALTIWCNHLWFYYAPVCEQKIKQCEDELIKALIPPLNDSFPAGVGSAVSAWRRQ